jgi:MFS family permease
MKALFADQPGGLADFKKLMSARFLFVFAVQMQAVVLGWQMYELTHDPLFLGFIGLAEALPALSLALYAGYVVDRSRPLVIYRRVIMVSFLSGLVMLLSQSRGLGLSVSGQVLALFASSCLTGTARGFSQPAIFATVPRIVPREDLPRASAWMTTSMQIARIAGPAMGGILFGWFGIRATAAAVCFTLLAARTAAGLIRAQPAPPVTTRPAGGAKPSVRDELLLGASFVFRHPILLPALSLDMISVLFGGVTALLPIYASDILKIGPRGLGALRAVPAVGAALTGAVLAWVDVRPRAGRLLFGSVAGFGACILVFGWSRSFALSLVALGLSGAFDSVSMIIRTSAVQLASPDAMRGRISAVNSMFIGSSNELGELESGIAARLLGAVNATLFGGVMCLLTVAGVAMLSPVLRGLDLRRLAREHAAADQAGSGTATGAGAGAQ